MPHTLASPRPRTVYITAADITAWSTAIGDLTHVISRQDRSHANNVATIRHRMDAVLNTERLDIDGTEFVPITVFEPLMWELQFRITGKHLGGNLDTELCRVADLIAGAVGQAVAK